jgi:preprotein translocase subunit YajC
MQGMLMQFLPIVVIFIIFYFLLIRPQKKKATEFKKLLEGLKKGDKIVTAGGIYGVIEAVNDSTVVVKIAENTKVKLNKNSVATVVTQDKDAE